LGLFNGLFTRKPTAAEIALQRIAGQLSDMQSVTANLSNYNSALQQSMLQLQFRMQNGFLRADTNNQVSYIRNGYH